MSQRRITDSAACSGPIATLEAAPPRVLPRRFGPGLVAADPLARASSASSYEVPPVSVPTKIEVAGSEENPSVVLMAAWLSRSLGVDAQIVDPSQDVLDYAGVHGVRLTREDGTIDLTRVSDEAIVLTLPTDDSGQHVTMPRRTLNELLAEELRRLDPDEVYGEVLATAFSGIDDMGTYASGKPAPTDSISADAEAVAADAAEATAAQLRHGPQGALLRAPRGHRRHRRHGDREGISRRALRRGCRRLPPAHLVGR